jgi:hypothetical protein
MNIILGRENIEQAQEKYTVLELDTLIINGAADPVTAYCLIEQVPIDQISGIDQFRDLHNNLMANYRKRNWKYCEDAIEHLRGKWGGELDSFYTEMSQRISQLRQQVLDDDWHGIINKTR